MINFYLILYFSQTLKFVNPCFLDDLVTVQGEVIDKITAAKIITVKTQIINESGQVLVKGKSNVLVRND